MRCAHWAAAIAAVVSLGLMIVVALRDVGFNVLNGWTILLGFVASVLLGRAESSSDASAGALLLILGLTPALIGGMGLLYLPAVVLAVTAAKQLRRQPAL